jgi:tetratricopeptide (TPR) repeat protein
MPKLPTTAPVSRGVSKPARSAGGWTLRVQDGRVAVVHAGAALPVGAVLDELAIGLPHVSFPFDFREGIGRFRHHRGDAETVMVSVEARLLLGWLHRVSGGRIVGRAVDDALVLLGRTDAGTRYTIRARMVPDPAGRDAGEHEPAVVLSLHDVRVYGPHPEPWPALAASILDLLPSELVLSRTLTTARLQIVRAVLLDVTSTLGWKMPECSGLRAHGVELREGVITARFLSPEAARAEVVTIDARGGFGERGLREAFERFVADLELKRHHGQIDRLLEDGQVREALAEVYRALDGPPEPGFLAERLVGICAATPILREEGLRVCQQLLEVEPGYPPALCGLASIAMAAGRREEAAVHLERLSEVLDGPMHREEATAVDLTLAELLSDVEPAEARAALERVLERSPDHEEALEQLIGLAQSAGEMDSALPLYKRLLFAARSPERTRQAGLSLARHALARHDPDEARIFLQVVLEAAPHDVEAQIALAQVEASAGEPRRAAKVLEGALRALHPSDIEALVRIVRLLADLALGPLAELGRARRVLWRAVDAEGLGAEDSTELARLAQRAGDADLMIRYALRVDRDSDAWPAAGCLLAQAHLARGARAEGIQAALDVLESAPANAEALELLEEAAAGVEVRERLLHRLREAAQSADAPELRGRLHRALARLYESLDLYADAIEPYEAALEALGPTADDRVADRLLALYERYGMWERHQRLCAARLDHVADPLARVPTLVRMGRVALRYLDDAAGARALLDQATALSPRRIDALELSWEALERLGELAALVTVLRRLESVHPRESGRRDAAFRLASVLAERDALGEARAVMGRLEARYDEPPSLTRLRTELTGVAASPAPHVPAPVSRGPQQGYSEALELADRGEAVAAIELLERVLTDAPSDVAARELHELLSGTVAASTGLAPAVVDSKPGELPVAVEDRLAASSRIEDLLGEARDGISASEAGAARWRLVGPILAEVHRLDAQCVEAWELKVQLQREAKAWELLVAALSSLADLTFDASRSIDLLRERARLLGTELDDRQAAATAWGRFFDWEPLDDEATQWLCSFHEEQGAWDLVCGLHGTRAAAAREREHEAEEPGDFRRVRVSARLEEARLQMQRLSNPAAAASAARDGLEASPDDPELLEVYVQALAAMNERVACREAIDRLIPHLVEGPLRDEMLLLRGT